MVAMSLNSLFRIFGAVSTSFRLLRFPDGASSLFPTGWWGGFSVPPLAHNRPTFLLKFMYFPHMLMVIAPAVSVRHFVRSLWAEMATSCNPILLLITSTWYRVYAVHSTVPSRTVSLWLGNGGHLGYFRVKRSRESSG